MTVTFVPAQKRIVLDLTDEEWSTGKFMSKIYGTTFLKDFLDKFFIQRKEQRKDRRREMMIAKFETLTPAQQAQILATMTLDFADE